MTKSLNKAILIGHVGKEPLTARTQNGHICIKFPFATNERWKNKDGTFSEKTTWHNIVIWNTALAKFTQKYVAKGAFLYIEGKIDNRSWENDDGKKQYISEVILQGYDAKLLLLDSRETTQNYNDPVEPTTNQNIEKKEYIRELDDDIPF